MLTSLKYVPETDYSFSSLFIIYRNFFSRKMKEESE